MALTTAPKSDGSGELVEYDSVAGGWRPSMPVVTVAPGALTLTYTDRSGTVTAGGTAQQMMAANTGRKKLYIQNPDTATEDLWVRFTGTAAVGGASSINLAPGDAWQEEGSGVTTQAVSCIAATTGHAWLALEGS